ncbi:hypothetical protein TWF694_011694 [Orbilia ellipsospora]|uniref:Putative peptidase inhibitor domain-containing protein n=1 Tax=Orbilia ellipsospora TaxID=2528407 RepID=A0AAV9X6A7_9PEZI
MPHNVIITVNSKEDKEPIRKEIEKAGGTITNEFTLIHAFSVTFPDDYVSTFHSDPRVKHVETDGEVRIQ